MLLIRQHEWLDLFDSGLVKCWSFSEFCHRLHSSTVSVMNSHWYVVIVLTPAGVCWAAGQANRLHRGNPQAASQARSRQPEPGAPLSGCHGCAPRDWPWPAGRGAACSFDVGKRQRRARLGRPRSGNARCVAGLAGGRVAPGCGCLWARRARRRGTSQSGCGDRRAKASRRSIRNHALFFPKILYKNIFFWEMWKQQVKRYVISTWTRGWFRHHLNPNGLLLHGFHRWSAASSSYVAIDIWDISYSERNSATRWSAEQHKSKTIDLVGCIVIECSCFTAERGRESCFVLWPKRAALLTYFTKA